MSTRRNVIDKAFAGYPDPLGKIVELAGVPDANFDENDGISRVGIIVYDTVSDDVYICTDITAGAANWVKINA